MTHLIPPRIHGAIDYAAVAVFALAPSIFGLLGMPAILAYVLAAAHLLLTLATNFPAGAVRLVPFPVHGGVEVAVAVILLLLPWLGGFAVVPTERNFYLAMGILLGLVWLLTDYRTEPERVPTGGSSGAP